MSLLGGFASKALSGANALAFKKLRKLIKASRNVAERKSLEQLTRRLSDEALKLVADGFRKERDPYGDPWAPLVSRKGRILQDTGRLARSYFRTANVSGFRIASRTKYAIVHQYGAAVPHRARYAAADAKGRFMAKRKASRARGAAVAVKRLAAHGQTIPARPMLPFEKLGAGPIWGPAFQKIARRSMARLFGQRLR